MHFFLGTLRVKHEFLYVFRDPNSLGTLSIFDESAKWAATGDFTDTDIAEAKLCVFQQVNKTLYLTPHTIGLDIQNF